MHGIHWLIVPWLAGLVLAVPGSAVVQARPPNIVVLLADDLGWGDLERHGGPARTPAIDRLAAEGVELHRCYAHPVCSPTRAALLTGCLPRRFGIDRPLGRRDPGLPAGLPTLPRTLSAAGYATNLVGKWHLGTSSPPLTSGFDHFYGFLGPEIDSFTHLDRRGDLDWQRDETPVEEQGYAAILMTDEAVRIIQRCDADRPFYLQVAFNVPHFPILAPAASTAKYAGLPEPQATRCGMIDVLDTSVARVLAALDARGLAEETIVLFLSDNGADRSGSNAPFRARKATVYEGGIRVPAIVRFPGRLPAATVSEQPIAIQDGGCCDTQAKLRSHDTSRIAWAKLMARVGEEFPLQCPACGGDIRLIAFITEPGPIRKILTHLGEPLEPPPVSPARGPPTAWGELVQMHDDREAVQVSPDELPAIDIHSL